MTRYRILVWLNGGWRVWHEGLALWQVELMFRSGMRVEKMSKFKNVLSLAVTNGIEGGGYFVTEDAIVRGGYEVGCALHGNVQNYTDDADWYLIKETIKNIEVL